MSNDWLEGLARIRLVANRVSFARVGVLALEVALGRGGKSTSREGSARNGRVGVTGAGLLAYAVFRFAQARYRRV